MRRVIKFGGTSLSSPQMVREGAEHIARLVGFGEQIAVVVSAPGNTTNELLDTFNQVSDGKAEFGASCEYAALGEEQSVHMMVAALRSLGVSAQPFLPREEESWPIIADLDDQSPIARSKINEERPFNLRTQQTVSRFRRFVLPHLRVGTVPVISGFFAVDSANRVVALGRGGSDITAFIVASQISADEIVIVTDVKGVLSADPRLAENPRMLETLSLEDLEAISGAGARVLHPRALKYKTENLNVRLMDYRELDTLEQSGTSVFGKSETILWSNPRELSALTIVGSQGRLMVPKQLMSDWMNEYSEQIVSLSISERFACYYLDSEVADEAYAKLHKLLSEDDGQLSSLSLKGAVGELKLKSTRFIDQPGVLSEITGVLSNARINVLEMITCLSDISVYVNYGDLEQAETLLRRVMERFTA